MDYKTSRATTPVLKIEVELMRGKDMEALKILKSNAMRETGKQLVIVQAGSDADMEQLHRETLQFSSASRMGKFR